MFRKKIEQVNKLITESYKNKVIFPSEFRSWYQILINDSKIFCNDPIVACHGDFSPNNVIIKKDKSVYFIDFQDACFDSPFRDLGWFLYISETTNQNYTEVLLSEYFNRKPTSLELKNIYFYKEMSAFFLGVLTRKLKTVNNPKELDVIFSKLQYGGTYYLNKKYTKDEINALSKEQKIEYSLSFFKDFLEINSLIK